MVDLGCVGEELQYSDRIAVVLQIERKYLVVIKGLSAYEA